MPTPYWEPSNQVPLSPLGQWVLPHPERKPRPPLSEAEQETEHSRVVKRMLGMWARTVQADAHSYWQAAMRAAWIDWAIDKMEKWSPSERDLPPALEQVWVRGYKLIMSTTRWNGLDEAQFTQLIAVRPASDTGKRKKWAIDELPGRQLFSRVSPKFDRGRLWHRQPRRSDQTGSRICICRQRRPRRTLRGP
jgi:hypothetical protein